MKKATKLVTMLVLFCLIFTACAGYNQPDATKTTGTQIETSETTGTTETTVQGFEEKSPESYSGAITLWTYDLNTDTAMAAEFNKTFPNIKVNIVPISDENEYITKLSSALSSGKGVPDVVTLEYNILGRFINTEQFEVLGDPPYNGNSFKDKMVEYMYSLGKNQKGQQIGMPVDPAPAGLFYRKDVIRKYLDTDDSAELEKMMSDWDKFMETAKIIKEKSGGKVYILPNASDIFRIIREQTEKSWIDENKKVLIESVYLDAAKTVEKMVAGNYFAKLEGWSAPWFASYSKGDVAFYADGLWLEGFVITQADAEGSGRWGVTKLPGGCVNRGGVNLAIPKGSENKEIAWQFVKWYTTTEAAAITTKKSTGGLTSYKPAYENPVYHEADSFMGGFKTAEFFYNEMNNNMKVTPVTSYDPILNDAVSKFISPFQEGQLKAEDFLKNVTDEVLQKIPGAAR